MDWRLAAIGVAVLVAVVIVFLVAIGSEAPNADAGTAQPDDGRGHVPICEPGNYSSVPPTSGCHLDPPAQWGAFVSPQDPVQLIHNLEHGGVVIWYQPDAVDADEAAALTDFVSTQLRDARFKFIVSPWDGPDFGHPIALTAWRRLLYLDSADLDAIGGFADANYGRAPEPQGGPPPPG